MYCIAACWFCGYGIDFLRWVVLCCLFDLALWWCLAVSWVSALCIGLRFGVVFSVGVRVSWGGWFDLLWVCGSDLDLVLRVGLAFVCLLCLRGWRGTVWFVE